MGVASDTNSPTRTYRVAICGNPNSGKTTIFNAITGLSQRVGNYPGVTVEKVSGRFSVGRDITYLFTVVDVPGTYSLAAFSPDEFIAISALSGEADGDQIPDAIICVIDATNLERGLYLLLQVLEIGQPVVVALNMIDLAEKRGMNIDTERLSQAIGGLPVVSVVGHRGKGIQQLKQETAKLVDSPSAINPGRLYDNVTENLLTELKDRFGNIHRTRAEYLRIIFDVGGPAEKRFLQEMGEQARSILARGREAIKGACPPSFSAAETTPLTRRATEIYRSVLNTKRPIQKTLSEKVDRYMLHPLLGPVRASR